MSLKLKSVILTKEEITRTLHRLTHEILEKNRGTSNLVLIGIKTRGEYLAKRVANIIKATEKHDISVGALDITLYRDDLLEAAEQPLVKSTEIPIDITNKKLVLVDDVLFTGRTIRAALDALIDLGRPANIQLAVLIDRGHRQLPINANYVGKTIPSSKKESVKVNLQEIDNQDSVVILGDKNG